MIDNTIDEDWLDDLEFLAHESPRSHVEIFRTDLLMLVDIAREYIALKSKEDAQ